MTGKSSSDIKIKTFEGTPIGSVSYLAHQIESLQRQGDTFTKSLEVERRRNEDLDTKIKKIKEELLEKKSASRNKKPKLSSKQLLILENRLEKHLHKYNETCNINAKLKAEIQNLRREKIQLHSIHDSLNREIGGTKSKIEKSLKTLSIANDARDKAIRNTEKVKARAMSNVHQFEEQWRLKKEKIEADQALLKTAVSTTSTAAATVAASLDATTVTDNETKEEDSSSTTTENVITVSLLNEKIHQLKILEKRVRDYESKFDTLWSETEVDNIESILAGYAESEEQNFSLFNMINELNTEMEDLDVKNHKLQEMITLCKGKDQASDVNRLKIKTHLEEQIHISEESTRIMEVSYNDSMAHIELLKPGIAALFQKVVTSLSHQHGTSHEIAATSTQSDHLLTLGVTELNIMTFLGLIEQRISESVQLHNIAHHAEEESGDTTNASTPAIQDLVSKGNALLMTSLPATDEYGDSDNEDAEDGNSSVVPKPCSIAELHQKNSAAYSKQAAASATNNNTTTTMSRRRKDTRI